MSRCHFLSAFSWRFASSFSSAAAADSQYACEGMDQSLQCSWFRLTDLEERLLLVFGDYDTGDNGDRPTLLELEPGLAVRQISTGCCTGGLPKLTHASA